MAGSDLWAHWRSALLSEGHDVSVVAVRNGRVQEANEAARRLFEGLHVGRDAAELFDESSRDKLGRLLRSPTSAAAELQIKQPNGPPMAARFVALAAPDEQLLLHGDGGLGYTNAIAAKLMDANSALANATRELSRRTVELENARRALEEVGDLRELFIAALAHDLKTPLNVILTSESLLRSGPPPSQAPETQAHVQRVERSAKRMVDLIDSLLLAAHFESASAEGASKTFEPVRLDEVARESAGDLEAIAQDAGVKLVVEAPRAVVVWGNRIWLSQLYANLLSNAIRHAPPGSDVTVTVWPDGLHARCEVCDRGDGVPREERERVFDRFVQTGPRRGTIGLGLYLCRKIAELHGGRIWVDDNPGGGARFVFQIPLEEARRPKARRASTLDSRR